MITASLAASLSHGTILYHMREKNSDGSPVRCRINGKCKLWKTRPDEFRLPVKYGLKTCFYINEQTAAGWTVNELEAKGEMPIGYMQGRGAS